MNEYFSSSGQASLESKISKKPSKSNVKFDRGSIGSSLKYRIGPPPKMNKEFRNDPSLVKGLLVNTALVG